MKNYKVIITTTFTKEVIITANSKADAIRTAENDEINGTDTFNFETTYKAKEVK